ncbi:tRNA lysidine(34) synthetase TilS [Helicobacter sp. T3_23-1056]
MKKTKNHLLDIPLSNAIATTLPLAYIDTHCKASTTKNLLAFSGGSDSVALFFGLMQNGVDFDIAIVDYGLREQSKEEVSYALNLAKKHNKQCFVKKSPKIKSNFEANARDFRYEFFEELIAKYGYENLLLAHHFNDKVEWFFMQLSKGAGLGNMLGFEGVEKREKGLIKKGVKYRIIRPMIWIQKGRILDFCKANGIKFFSDCSNFDSTYKRNFMRLNFVNDFVKEFGKGVIFSFELLECEKNALYAGRVKDFGKFCIIEARNVLEALHHIDKYAKQNGYVISSKQRDEIVRCGFACEVGGASRAKNLTNKNSDKSAGRIKQATITQARITQKGFMLENISNLFENLSKNTNEENKKIYIFIRGLNIANNTESNNAKNAKMQKMPKNTKTTKPQKTSNATSLPKDFKEFARKSKIPKRMRKTLYDFSLEKGLSYQKTLESIIKYFCF